MGPEAKEWECENCGSGDAYAVYELKGLTYKLSRPRPLFYNRVIVCDCGAVNPIEESGVSNG